MLICTLLAAFLPAIASTGFVRAKALQTINSKIAGRLEIDDAAFSWRSRQEFRGIRIIDPEGAQVATIDHIHAGPSIWTLIMGGRELYCHIEKLDADVVLDEQGISNLQKAIATTPPQTSSPSQPEDKLPGEPQSLFTGSATLELIDATIRARGPSMPDTAAHFNTQLHYDGSAGTLQWRLVGETEIVGTGVPGTKSSERNETKGRLDVAVNVIEFADEAGRLQSDNLKADANVTIQGFPMAFADVFLELDGLATAAIGQTLDLNLTANRSPSDIDLKLVTKSANLDAKIALSAMDDQLTLKEPGTVGLAISKALIDHLQSSEALPAVIEAPFNTSLTLDSFSLPIDTDDLRSTAFSANLELTPVNLRLLENDFRTRMDSTRLTAASSRLQNGIESVLGTTIVVGGQSSRSQIAMELTDLFNKDLQLSMADTTVKLDGTIDAPVDVLTTFVTDVGQRDMLSAVFGTKMNVNVRADAGKKLQRATVKLDSNNADASANATLTNNRLILNEPLVATQVISPELSRTLLKGVNPLLVTAVGSERPVKLQIQSEGFVFPLQEGISGFDMPKATLDFGKVLLNNGGVLGRLVTLLKQRSLASTKQLEAWFTPIHTTVKQGVATYERSDMLVGGSLHLATWGFINLTNNQMDMVIGLPADTLDDAFDLEGLAADYVLQIPVKGTTEAPEIDWASAGRQVAALAAEKELGGKLGKATELVSGVKDLVNKATGASVVPKMPPAPPAPKLPWKSEGAATKPPKQQEPETTAPKSQVKDLLNSVFR